MVILVFCWLKKVDVLSQPEIVGSRARETECVCLVFSVLVVSDLLTSITERTDLDLAQWANGQRPFDFSFRRIL